MAPRLTKRTTDPRPKVLVKLAELEQAVKDASAAHEQADLDFSRAKRNVARATGAMRDYLASTARQGIDPDPKKLAELRKAKAEAEANSMTRPVMSQGREISTETIDLAAEARRDAAYDALTDAISERSRYIQEHRTEIGEARTPEALQARDELFEAWEHFQAKLGQWSRVRNSWSLMLEQWGMAPHELPVNGVGPASGEMATAFAPMSFGKRRDPRDFIPMPRSLAPHEGTDTPAEDPNVVTDPVLTRTTSTTSIA